MSCEILNFKLSLMVSFKDMTAYLHNQYNFKLVLTVC